MQLIEFSSLSPAENKRLMRLISYSVDHNKLWGEDTGRSITGDFTGSLLGLFPKIKITIHCQNKADRKLVLKVFTKEYERVKYYDPLKGGYIENKEFYFGDTTTTVKKAVGQSDNAIRYDKIDVELVATKKLTQEELNGG